MGCEYEKHECEDMAKIDIGDLSVEITAASVIIIGLANQCCDTSDRLTNESMQLALFGISRYLDRIADDVKELQEREEQSHELFSNR